MKQIKIGQGAKVSWRQLAFDNASSFICLQVPQDVPILSPRPGDNKCRQLLNLRYGSIATISNRSLLDDLIHVELFSLALRIDYAVNSRAKLQRGLNTIYIVARVAGATQASEQPWNS